MWAFASLFFAQYNYFRMQLKIEHEHQVPDKKQPVKADSPKNSVKKSGSKKNVEPPPPSVPDFAKPVQLVQHQGLCYSFHTDGLQQLRLQSIADFPQTVVEVIKERKNFCEERVYQAIVNTNVDFIGVHFKDCKAGLKSELNCMFETIHNEVEAAIWDGQYDIEKRNNYFSYNSREQELLTHITEELVRKNIKKFRMELDQSEATSQYLDVSVQQKARSDFDKAKVAQYFVKKMQEEHSKHKQFLNQKKVEERELEVKSMHERKLREDEEKKERHEKVLKRIQKRKEKMSIEADHSKKIQSEYLKFITHKKPAHEQMQRKFQERRMDEQKQKLRRMNEMMDARKQLTMEELQDHMDRYDELLYEHEALRRQKRQLKEHEMEIIAENQPYRSKFYSRVIKSSPKVDEKEVRSALMKKQNYFAEHVKKNYVPRIDEKKHQEIQELMRRMSTQKKNAKNSRHYIEEGKRNLQKLHLLIGQLKAKNKIKDSTLHESLPASTPRPRKYKNYLEEIKESRFGGKEGTSFSVDYDRKLQKEDSQFVKIEALRKQNKAHQRDRYLDSAVETLDFDSHMHGKKEVEHDYIQAANAKLAILRRHNQQFPATIQ